MKVYIKYIKKYDDIIISQCVNVLFKRKSKYIIKKRTYNANIFIFF